MTPLHQKALVALVSLVCSVYLVEPDEPDRTRRKHVSDAPLSANNDPLYGAASARAQGAASLPSRFSYLGMYVSLTRKTTADEEPASVTDETLASDSAGHHEYGELGLPS